METRTATHLFKSPLSMMTPSGEPLAVRADQIDLLYIDDVLDECRLAVVVQPLEYGEVDRRWLFHLTEGVRLSGGESFDPGKEVRIEARLDSDLLPGLSSPDLTALDAANMLERLTAEEPDHTLLATENWYALHVTQDVPLPDGMEGTLRAGYSTTWAHEARAELPEIPTDTLLGEIAACFRQEALDYDYEEDEPFIHSQFEGNNGDFELYAFAREEQRQVVVYSVYEEGAPAERRAAAAELIARANYGLILGNFELDFDDGEIRFRTSRAIGAGPLDPDVMHDLIATNVSAMDLYLPAIASVLTGELSPAAAVERVESGPNGID